MLAVNVYTGLTLALASSGAPSGASSTGRTTSLVVAPSP